MADRTVENASTEVPEMPDILEKVLLFALNEAKDKAEKGEDVIPFTALVVKEDLFLESHPGESAEECFAFARHTVQGARGADAYALCYDGYIETDDGVKDALIAEGGVPGADEGLVFEQEAVYVGSAPNFMVALRAAGDYADDEIDERYREDGEEVVEEA